MIKKKSIGINAIVNGLKTVISLLFPLITYPYITRVLRVENVGRYNFCHSVIDYFYLLSALGIATYAVREGTKYRESKDKVSAFASEVFTINIVSTLISYALLGIIILASPKLQDYYAILLALSVSMIFTTIGCEWVYTMYEEYVYIALRTIIFQIVSLTLMYIFVRSENDVIWYAIVIVVSNSGANIINLLGLKKYCDIRPCFNRNVLKHLAPILILFANSVATRIYVNSDITVLGFLTSDYNVGIYTIASKIYSITKQVLAAVIIVSIPRLSFYWGHGKQEEYEKLANRILYILVTLVLPVVVGLFSLSKEVILTISTKEFITAQVPLQILSGALFFCLFNWFFTSCVLIPCKREKHILLATVVSAALNVGLNFVLIPVFNESAAALTTLVAEACSLAICIYNSRNLIKIKFQWKDILSTVLGCFAVFFICKATLSLNLSSIVTIITGIIASVIGYALILLVLRNSIAKFVVGEIIKKVFK